MRSAVSCAFWGMVSMPRPSRLIIAGILMMLMAARASAQKPEEKPADKSMEKSGDKADKAKHEKKQEEKVVQTKHSVKIGGQEIKYTATAGTILLKLEDGTQKASVFYVAYTKDDVSDTAKRPVTFTFNGGPGGGSILVALWAFWSRPGG